MSVVRTSMALPTRAKKASKRQLHSPLRQHLTFSKKNTRRNFGLISWEKFPPGKQQLCS